MSIAKGALSPFYSAAPFSRIELPIAGRKVELVAGRAAAHPVEGTRILVDDEPVSLTYREWVTHVKDGRLETEQHHRGEGSGLPIDLLGYCEAHVFTRDAFSIRFPHLVAGSWLLSGMLVQLKSQGSRPRREEEPKTVGHADVRVEVCTREAAVALRAQGNEVAQRFAATAGRSPERTFGADPGCDSEGARTVYAGLIERFRATPSPSIRLDLRGRRIEIVAGCRVFVDGAPVPMSCTWQSRSMRNASDHTCIRARLPHVPHIPFDLAECRGVIATDHPEEGVTIRLRGRGDRLGGGYEPIWTSHSVEIALGADLVRAEATIEDGSDSSQ